MFSSPNILPPRLLAAEELELFGAAAMIGMDGAVALRVRKARWMALAALERRCEEERRAAVAARGPEEEVRRAEDVNRPRALRPALRVRNARWMALAAFERRAEERRALEVRRAEPGRAW